MILLIILTFLTYRITKKLKDTQNEQVQQNYVYNSTFEIPNKNDCTETSTFCFNDINCIAACKNSNLMKCIKGKCRNQNIVESTINNKCNPKNGVTGFLVGNPSFGMYSFICKSVDPGIASVDDNLMCKNQNPPIEINYLKMFPTIQECTCKDKMLVPSTRVKREHYECSPFANMVVD